MRVSVFLAAVMLLALAACTATRHSTAAHGAPSAPAAAEEDARGLVLPAYGIELRSPGEAYTLLEPERARRLNPDAVAGIVTSDTGFLVVLERSPGMDAETLARLVLDGITMHEKRLVSMEQVSFEGHSAVRMVTVGLMEDRPTRIVHLVFVRQGVGHQLVAWGGDPDDLSGESLKPLFESVTLLEGPIEATSAIAPSKDVDGVGWRLRDGRFESGALGLVVDPGESFRVIIGEELAHLNEDAEVGLASLCGDVYMVIIAERTPPSFERASRRAVRAGLQETLGAAFDGTEILLDVDAKPMGVERVPGDFDYHLGMHCRGGVCVQLHLWFFAGLRDHARALIESSPPSITLMEPSEREASRRELAEERRRPTIVGRDHSFRNGVYTSFELGLRLRLPDEGFWRLRTGQIVATSDPRALFEVEEPAEGIHGSVLVEWLDPKMGLTNPELFHSEVRHHFGEAGAGPERGTLGDVESLESRFLVKEDDLTLSFRVVTAVHGEIGYVISFWGYPELMDAAEESISELLRGLEMVEGGIETIEQRGRHFVDRRMGYSVRLPPGVWKAVDVTPDALPAVGSMRLWERETAGLEEAVMVTALYRGVEDEDLDMLFDMAAGMAKTPPPGIHWLTSDFVPGHLGDMNARCRTAAGPPGRMDICVATHGPMIYTVFYTSLGQRPGDPSAFFSSFAVEGR